MFCIVLNIRAECWIQTADVHGWGGVGRDVSDLQQCQAACVGVSGSNSNQRCVAIDWQPSNDENNCWLLSDTRTGPTSQNGIIWHYELVHICPSKLHFFGTKFTNALYRVAQTNVNHYRESSLSRVKYKIFINFDYKMSTKYNKSVLSILCGPNL